MVENYLKENNNEHIIGGPYNSQYQGAVEAFNKTIKMFDISQGSSRGDVFVKSILLMISVYLIITEGKALPKSDKLD